MAIPLQLIGDMLGMPDGDRSALPVSAAIFSTTSRGVPAGTHQPCQLSATKPGTPCSAMVGTFGKNLIRLAVVTASALTCPPSTAGTPVATGKIAT